MQEDWFQSSLFFYVTTKMNYKKLILAKTLFVTASMANAGALGVDITQLAYAGDAGIAVANGITGGVTSSYGSVKAKGGVEGNVTNIASGEGSKARTSVGSNRGVTAKLDIEAEGYVKGNITNIAAGKDSEAIISIGSNGN